jgi:hypothetical protein
MLEGVSGHWASSLTSGIWIDAVRERHPPGLTRLFIVLTVEPPTGVHCSLSGRLATVASDHLSPVRTMFLAYWVFILAVFAVYFYVGLANR